jgi:hypothetical protein
MKRSIFSGAFWVIMITGLLMGGCSGAGPLKEKADDITLPPQDDGLPEDPSPAEQNFHIYLAIGQSNMQGPGAIEDQDRRGISDRFRVLNVLAETYNGENRAAGQWYKAVPPLIIPDRNLTNYLGLQTGLSPADYFGRHLMENTPETISIGVIAIASGDLALAAFDKTRARDYYDGSASSTAKQGMDKYNKNMYASLIEMARIAQELGVIKGIIVHQGETGAGLTGVGWGDLLKTIYDDILADLGLAANSIPILVGQTYNGGAGKTGGDLNNIRNFIPNAYVISSAGCAGRVGANGQVDGVHFGSAGLRELGTRYGAKMLELNYPAGN